MNMKVLKPHEQFELEAYLKMAEYALASAHLVARTATRTSTSPFTTSSMELSKRISKLHSEALEIRGELKQGQHTSTPITHRQELDV